MRIGVLGGGLQGRVIAEDLAIDFEVTIADLREVDLAGTKSLCIDLSDSEAMISFMKEQDLIVGALPARLGFQAAKAAVVAKKNYIDIAFYEEDPAPLHEAACEAGIAIVPDCGLAPGISNLIVGRELEKGLPDEIHIKVGGFSEDPADPYGYAITWSPDDLLDEYTRPARILSGGKVVSVPVLSGRKKIHVDGVGEIEEFFTDGLRTLLSCGVGEMTEKTLRWPGHLDQIQPLLENGTLVEELRKNCSGKRDLVVFRVDVIREGHRERYGFMQRASDGLSAMARTTALTCASVARWAATSGVGKTGVLPLEKIGGDEKVFETIVHLLGTKGIKIIHEEVPVSVQ